MAEFTFVIYGRLPSLNEVLDSMNSQHGRWNRWNEEKRKYEAQVIDAIEKAGKPAHMFVKPVRIHCRFYEPNRKRDADNISAGAHKIIFDALQKAEIIKNDSAKFVHGHSDEILCDPADPRIEVTVFEDSDYFRQKWHDLFARIESIEPHDTDWE